MLKIEEERKIKEQIAKEQAEEEAKQRKDKGVTPVVVTEGLEVTDLSDPSVVEG